MAREVGASVWALMRRSRYGGRKARSATRRMLGQRLYSWPNIYGVLNYYEVAMHNGRPEVFYRGAQSALVSRKDGEP